MASNIGWLCVLIFIHIYIHNLGELDHSILTNNKNQFDHQFITTEKDVQFDYVYNGTKERSTQKSEACSCIFSLFEGTLKCIKYKLYTLVVFNHYCSAVIS